MQKPVGVVFEKSSLVCPLICCLLMTQLLVIGYALCAMRYALPLATTYEFLVRAAGKAGVPVLP